LIFASLYQDKEDREKVNANEGEAYKDAVLELLDIYNLDDDSNSLSWNSDFWFYNQNRHRRVSTILRCLQDPAIQF
jgi:hypothetical protein